VGTALRTLARSFDPQERRRLGAFLGGVVLLHLLGWGALLLYGVAHPALLALGGVAYTFGLRHAFDADHISAIDNTTRKLLRDKQRPMGVGFFFSLGHSTVVLLIAAGLGLAVRSIVQGVHSGQLKGYGSIVGSGVSGVFLLLIGIVNLVILLDILRVYRRMRSGTYDRHGLSHELIAGGFMMKVFGRLFKLIRHSWQMYPVGFLFGLGFDTASEVSLLAVSAGAAAQGLPLPAILSLPVIFAAGMSGMDTLDGAFMAKAYSWAFSNPVRKVFYNLTVTGLSVFVALFVGGIEVAQIGIQALGLRGAPFDAVAHLDFGSIGLFIVGAFVVTWAAAFAVYRLRRVEERWSALVDRRELS
jgi:nickel/cobalt transporter (NiCoT) family protein